LAQSSISIAVARGERIHPECHHTRADVKAVTLHHFSLQKIPSGWQARVIQDIRHPG
jgi:SHS2 domain-containing protein